MRTARALTALTLIAGLLVVPPAADRSAAAVSADCDRTPVMIAWQSGGSQVRAAAEQALLGGDADVCAFVDTTWAGRAKVDERLAVNQLMAGGGPSVRAAAQQALDATDPAALGAFLDSGWRQPWLLDQRLRINQMMAGGGAQLRSAAQKALDNGTSAALATFLDSGWRQPEYTDQRLRTNQILAAGGPEVKVAAQRALDAGTLDALTRFINVDWGVAAARDQETQTLTDLVKAAEVAGARAEVETTAAKAESQRAVAEADAARKAAQAAAAAAAQAQGNAAVAAAESQRAAQAADRAAAAAQEAVAAARAASAAARVAAGAAARAATAATRTGQAAARAYQAAALAATSTAEAQRARDAAVLARKAAQQTQQVAEAARRAGEAAFLAAYAASEAEGAANAANASAQAAREAGDWANQAGADGAAARAAAARAQANANRAIRAARAAAAYANTAGDAAMKARDAANRAVANANTAAAAAEDAAEHAGESAQAAARATAHANAATLAAQDAVAAAVQAQAVYEAGRAADAERVQIAYEQGDEAARAIAEQVTAQQARAAWDAEQAARRTAETNRLITVASDPATPTADAVRAARQVALTLSNADGSWTRAAARHALAGDDAFVLEFVRTGVAVAAGQDDRATLAGLMVTGTDAMRAAAQTALAGSDADVAAFLRTRDYPQRAAEDRLSVNQIQAAARDRADTATVEYAQRALDAGTAAALRQFLEVTQYAAAATDRRLKVNQILASPDSGPEVAAAAQIALDGPPALLDKFLDVDRYAAAQRDQDTAAHDAVVSALLAQATQVANLAVQNAMLAQQTAATARGAAAEAAGYAQEAVAAATTAAGYAQRAQQSAALAEQSAARAAASARTAVAAAQSATGSARRAAQSAAWATASAEQAAGYATNAIASAQRAYDAALAAGRSAQQAAEDFTVALNAAKQLGADEAARWAQRESQRCQAPGVPDPQGCLAQVYEIIENPARVAYLNAGTCELFYQQGSQLYNACLKDVLNPNFQATQELTLLTAFLADLTAFYTAFAGVISLVAAAYLGAGLAVGLAACAVCAPILEFFAPVLSPELVGVPLFLSPAFAGGGGVVAGTAIGIRAAAWLERLGVQARAEEGALARFVAALRQSCGPNSFTADTKVLLADGTSKPISEIRLGDRVLSTDPASGVTESEPVTATIVGSGVKRLVDLTVGADATAKDGTATVTATDRHPFWAADLRQWVGAAELQSGQWLRTSAGTWVQVTATRQHTEPATVHNLTVAGHHTYYVLAGTTSVLVHNQGWTVPDDFIILRGGTGDWPPPGTIISGVMGESVEDAAMALAWGKMRVTTAGEIRAAGGTVTYAPELTRAGLMNYKHVNVVLGATNPFSATIYDNPVAPARMRMHIMALGVPRC
ncbi:polymorphic toxin-type HINT domain-containing protein [Hamadaea sp. NPDC051192]|uniref:polymorphic toxin-type HINT domain-containing protein n=1 Tax=Hamadaea sp. NPDC051192 TaxID=3154940 RepID=UPI003427B62B